MSGPKTEVKGHLWVKSIIVIAIICAYNNLAYVSEAGKAPAEGIKESQSRALCGNKLITVKYEL